MPTVTFTGVKSLAPARDGAVDIVFATRYSGDLSVTVTSGCWDALLAALAGSAAPVAAREAEAAAPLAASNGAAASKAAPEPRPEAAPTMPAPEPAARANGADAPGGQLQVRLPKKWVVAADLKLHDVVLVVFDPRTKGEAAFALNPDAASKMAEGLTHHARAVADSIAKKKGEAPAAPH